ncbi:hypothetical protein IJ541_07670 [bacterium]|nr:hypothetical protein [bacterium]
MQKNNCHPELVSWSQKQILKHLTALPTDTGSHKNFQMLNHRVGTENYVSQAQLIF